MSEPEDPLRRRYRGSTSILNPIWTLAIRRNFCRRVSLAVRPKVESWFAVFPVSAQGRRTLERTIEWNDVVFDIGADVRGETKSTSPALFCRVTSSTRRPRLAARAGLHWLDVSAQISGEATLGDGTTGFAASKASASLPIPNVGATYKYSPSAKWLYGVRFDWFLGQCW